MKKKIAIILMNLGGPDSLKAVRPFLFNLFYDKAIIRVPNPFRWMIAMVISLFRNNYSKNIYKKMGGKSPLLQETEQQKTSIQNLLNHESYDFNIFIYMRYWHPRAKEVALSVRQYNPEEIILVPLYPHFSTTTTQSSIQEIEKYLEGFNIKKIYDYHNYPLFIDAHVYNIKTKLNNIKDFSNSILFFSAHSIPEKFVIDGDPYQMQTEVSVKEIMKKLNIKGLEHKITYQSKVGRMKWLSPSTEDEILLAAQANKEIYVVPISFVSENSETLVELDIDYRSLAEENGALNYYRFPTLSNSPLYIKALTELINSKIEKHD